MNVLRVMTYGSSEGKKSQVIYINAQDIFRDFTHEPWIFDHFKRLSNVRSYCVTTFGDGSTSKVGSAKQHTSAIPDPCPNPTDRRDNIWWSIGNNLKQCLLGCITNILHHTSAGSNAMKFKRLSTLDDQSLLLELGIKEFPNYVT